MKFPGIASGIPGFPGIAFVYITSKIKMKIVLQFIFFMFSRHTDPFSHGMLLIFYELIGSLPTCIYIYYFTLEYLHSKQNLPDFTGTKVSKAALQMTAMKFGKRLFAQEDEGDSLKADDDINDVPCSDLKSELMKIEGH